MAYAIAIFVGGVLGGGQRGRLRPLRRRPARLAAGAGVAAAARHRCLARIAERTARSRGDRDRACGRGSSRTCGPAPAGGGAARTGGRDERERRRRDAEGRCDRCRGAIRSRHRADAGRAYAASFAAAADRRGAVAALAARDAQAVAGRRQHHRQGRRRDPLRRPGLSRQVRCRAHRGAGGMAAGGDRRRRRGPARLRLAAAPVAARLCAGAAGRRGRGALPHAVRGVPLLPADRSRPGLRPDGRGRDARGGARGAAGRARARRHRRARRLRHAADRLHRLRQRGRALRLLPRARRRHRRGRVVSDLALAQPGRLLRHLPRRHRLGRAPLPAGIVRDERELPDRLLPPVRAHHAAAGAARGRRAARSAATPGSTAPCCSVCRRSSSPCSTGWCATWSTAPRFRRWRWPPSTSCWQRR